MDLLTQANTSLNNIAVMAANIEADLAEFKAKYGNNEIKAEKPTNLKDQQVSLTWSEMVKFNISTTSFPQVDNYTHFIKRVVKNITREDDTLKGFVKMGGQTLIVTKDANYTNDSWDIQGVL